MKHTRTKRMGGLPIQQVTITATLEWSDGIPYTLEQGEPGAEIQAGPLTVSLTFRDVEDLPSGVRGSLTSRKLTDPAQWIVDEVGVYYRISDGRRQALAWGEKPKRRGRALRLAALPDVLEVVQAACEDHIAIERISTARESVYFLLAQADAIRSESASHGYGPLSVKEQADIRQLETAAAEARRDLAEAERVATERGVK